MNSDSNNQRLMLGDSALLPVGGPGGKVIGGLKSQGTVTSAKQMRIDQKKYNTLTLYEYIM